MPKLYYTTTSCGAASFIAASIAGVTIESEQVNLQTHLTASGADFYAINPKGNVPALVLDDGTLLNEGSAVLQYFADQNAASGLAPAYGTVGRYKVMNMLNFTASEYHIAIGGLFNPTLDEAGKAAQKARAYTKLAFAEKHLVPEGTFLFGDALTVADLYFWIVTSWCGYLGVDLTDYPKVAAHFAKVSADPRIAEGKAKMA